MIRSENMRPKIAVIIRLFILLLSTGIIQSAYAHKYSIRRISDRIIDTILPFDTGVLYYSVENILESTDESRIDDYGSSDDFGSTSIGTSTRTKIRNDKYLIPYIISQIDQNTIYKMDSNKMLSLNKNKPHGSYISLTISINKLNDYLEYQFLLCKKTVTSIKDTTIKAGFEKRKIKIPNTYNTTILKWSSFFINPDNPDYLNTIKTEIQRLFDGPEGTNKPPVAIISIDNKLTSPIEAYKISDKDTIILDGSLSMDIETPQRYLKYIWTVKKTTLTELRDFINMKKPRPYTDAFISNFNLDAKQQKLSISDPGLYEFALVVNDGVVSSDTAYVYIKVTKKPTLTLNQDYHVFTYQRNILGKSGNANIFIKLWNCGFRIKDEMQNFAPHFDYLYSCNNSINYFSMDDTISQSLSKKKLKEYRKCIICNPVPEVVNTKIPGFKINCIFLNRKNVSYKITHLIKPGNHYFGVFVDNRDVKSNTDTLRISYKRKSIFSIIQGYQNYQITWGGEFFNGISLNVFRFGLRGYFTHRWFIDAHLLLPFYSRGALAEDRRKAGTAVLTGSLNYDIPLNSNDLGNVDLPMFLSPYASYYRLIINEDFSAKGYQQWGIGAKFRIQLFANKPNLGVIYFEPEAGIYYEFKKDPYQTVTMGLSLVYGICSY